MSHKETVIEPAEGLTVIAGENNCGKSAIVSAIQCVCSNATGDYMVRHGEKECRVILETDDGHTIEWKRASKKVSYVVDGEAIDRTRGKVPEKVEAVLRMSKVVAENEEFDVHFGEQKNPIFLLNGTSGQRAAFFASSSDAAKLIEMQSLHKSKLTDANRNLKEYQKRETNFLLRLEKLNPLDSIHTWIESAEKIDKQLNASDNQRLNLEKLLFDLQAESANVEKYDSLATQLARLETPPEFVEHTPLDSVFRDLNQSTLAHSQAKQVVTALAEIPQSPEFADDQLLQQLVRDIRNTRTDFDKLLRRSVYLQLPDAPDVGQVTPLEELIAQAEKLQQQVELFENTTTAIPRLKVIEPPVGEEVLAKHIVLQNQIIQEITELKTKLDQVTLETQNAHNEFHTALDASGTCPTCGQEFQKTEVTP